MIPGINENRVASRTPYSSAPPCQQHRRPGSATGREARIRLPNTPAPSGFSTQHRPVITGRPGNGGATVPGPGHRAAIRTKAGSPIASSRNFDRPPSAVIGSSASSSNTRLQSLNGQGGKGIDQFPKFNIGIETEFLVESRGESMRRSNVVAFMIDMARLHNEKVEQQYPRMETIFEDDDWFPGENDFKYWVLANENDLLPRGLISGKWGLELKSPKISVSRGSDWTRPVKETWAFIEKHYMVTKNQMCGTHVHISLEREGSGAAGGGIGMSLQDIKRIAQCAIHFEPAIEALVPPERRRNVFIMSNWIDNAKFADERVTRQVAIEMIEECAHVNEIISLLCPIPQDRNFAWNFRALRRFGTIEFRKGGASLNAAEALAWAELTLLFAEAALQVAPKSLRTMPANIRGLKTFLGPDKLNYLRAMFDGKSGDESLQPQIIMTDDGKQEEILRKKLKYDEELQRQLAKKTAN